MEPNFDFKTVFDLSGDPGQMTVEDKTVYNVNDPDTNISSEITVTAPTGVLPLMAIDNDQNVISGPISIPKDYDQNIVSGIYSFSIVTTIVDKYYEHDIISTTAGPTVILTIAGDQTAQIPTTLDIINAPAGNGTYNILSINYNSVTGYTEYEIDPDPGVIINSGQITYNYTTVYTTVIEYDFCYTPVEIEISMNSSCVTSELVSRDITQYGNYYSMSRTHTVKYPDGLEDAIADIVEPLQTVHVSPIYTKTWTSVVRTDITYVQADGLYIVDQLVGSAEHTVDCSISFCKIYQCLKNFYDLWQSKKADNPVEGKRLGYVWGQMNALLHLAQIASDCGKNDDLRCYYAQIKELLNANRCDCHCEELDSSVPTLIEGVVPCGCSGGMTVVENTDGSINVDVNVEGSVTTYVVSVNQALLDALDGEDGLGYDNMTSNVAFNESAAVNFVVIGTMTAGKAVQTGTRLRLTRTDDPTKYVEGVVDNYDVVTGAFQITIDYKSAAASGTAASGYYISVAGDPGIGIAGANGIGYDNMTSAAAFNESSVPFTTNAAISAGKAVTTGTRLRYTRVGDVTKWVEGVVNTYNIGSGATNISFDSKSPAAAGNAPSGYYVTVIGEPGIGVGFDNITNIGTGVDGYKGINGTDAEFYRLLGAAGLLNGVAIVGDDVVFSPLTEDSYVSVYDGGVGTPPVFSYSAVGPDESLLQAGSININTSVGYHDFNDFIYVVFRIVIDNFHLTTTGGKSYSLTFPQLEIPGLPIAFGGLGSTYFLPVYTGVFNLAPYNNLPTQANAPEVRMDLRRNWNWFAATGKLVSATDAFYGNSLPISPYPDPVALVFNGSFIVRKDL